MCYVYAWFKRQGNGKGSARSNFNLSIVGDYFCKFDFNISYNTPFLESIFRFHDQFTIIPGYRFEYRRSTAKGYKEVDNIRQIANESGDRIIPLFGLSAEYKGNTNIYTNIGQAYRQFYFPIIFSFDKSSSGGKFKDV